MIARSERDHDHGVGSGECRDQWNRPRDHDTHNPSFPTLSQNTKPVATTPTIIRLISWKKPKIPLPLHRQSEQTASERQDKKKKFNN